MISDLWNDGWVGRTILAIFGAAILMVPVVIFAMIAEERAWDEFKEAHACRIVGKTSSSVGTGVTTTISPQGQVSIGPTTVVISGKTGWLCDDSVTYWR